MVLQTIKQKFLLAAVGLPLLAAGPTASADQWRSTAPNERSATAPSQQTLLEMYQQMQALQEEVAMLRNKVEVQENEMQRLQNRLRSVTEDLDRRVQQLERGGSARTPAGDNAAAATPPPAVAGQGDQKAYEAAFRLMKQGDYSRASRSFRQFLATYPNSPLAGNAQYWIGEANYLVRNYKLALDEFQKVRAEHPGSRKVPDAMLKSGYCYYELKDYDSAKQVLNEVVLRYPNTLVARSAKSRLALIKKEGH
jgi:tol-pal system protein YbgF